MRSDVEMEGASVAAVDDVNDKQTNLI